MSQHLLLWWNDRSSRERRLLIAALAILAAVIVLQTASWTRDGLAMRQRRVVTLEREYREVRALAARVRGTLVTVASGMPLMSRLDAVASATVGRDHLAAMTPVIGTANAGEAFSVRLVDVSLEETVRLLHAIGIDDGADHPTALQLVAHPDAPDVFDAVIEVRGPRYRP